MHSVAVNGSCRLAALLALVPCLIASFPAQAQNCRKGKPCGNSCIAREKVCRVRPGTARWAPGADTITGIEPHGRTVGPVPLDSGAGRIFGALPEEKRSSCVVASITDGDTFRCVGGRRVRLLLIDAPERDQGPFGAVATRGLAQLIGPGSHVVLELDVEERDRYGRTLAYVYLPDGRMANEELARQGLVVVSVYPPNVRYVERMRAAVDEARQARRGLWSTSAFNCAPADHRRGRC